MARYDWPAPPRGDDRPQARAAFLDRYRPMQDPGTTGPLPKRARSRSRRAVAHTAPSGDHNLWLPIGPTVMTNGQAGGDPNVAGRIRDLQIEPVKGRRLYAASAGGGAWFSADRGETWTPLDDFQLSDLSDVATIASALSCGAVHVIWGAQDDGSDDVIWVGTGEPRLAAGGLMPALPAGGDPGGGLPGGNLLGVGFLNRDPAVAAGAWQVVKGDVRTTDPDTLRGHGFFRIAGDPSVKNQLVAATTNGLYVLVPGGTWTKAVSWVNGLATQPLDVVLTRLAPDKLRIWVATASALMAAELTGADANPINLGALVFTAIGLPGVAKNPLPRTARLNQGGTRIRLATDGTKLFALGRAVIPAGNSRQDPPAALWLVDAAAASLAGLAAVRLTGMAEDLFLSASDQSDYDMCIETHPTTAGRVYVGGATVSTSTGWNAALYRCDTTATAANPTLIGEGVHADVHVVRGGPVSPADATKHTLWVGCDGGLFRSDADGDAGTFANRNDGLAVLQPGFVASHPTNPGVVAAGFQDNGTAIRTGDGVWRQSFRGDGGGVVFDPADKGRYFRQYTQATWNSSDGSGIAPVERRQARAKSALKTSETIESQASLFYSGATAVRHGDETHLAFGSDRVWYSRDWGRSWVTLPTATDPRGGDNPNLAQDVLNPVAGPATYSDTVGSTDCCSSTYVGTGASGSGVITVKLSVAPNDAGGRLVLRAVALYATGVVWMVGSRAAGASAPFTWTPMATTPRQKIKDPLPGAETTAFQAGQPLAFLPAAGIVSDLSVHDPALGPLGSCYVTTTGTPYGGTGRDTLWFFDGKDQWMPTGLRNPHANGTWSTPADRVTSPALGVLVDPDLPNTVYVATSVGVVKGTLTIGGAPTYSWVWERFMNGLPTAAVQDLSLFSGSGVKLLRAAIQSRGVWEVDLGQVVTKPRTFLRLYPTDTRRVLPTPTGGALLNGDQQNPVHWDDSPDIVIDTTGAAAATGPTESQLAKVPKAGPATDRAQVSTKARHLKVHVLVHHRWSDALPAAKVKVALLRHSYPPDGVVPITQLWPALVAAAPSAAAQPAALPDGWSRASTDLWQSPADGVDTRVPKAVTFDVDLSADATGSAVVFLAVVMSELDQISAADLALGGANTAQTGDQLVTSSPHVAAKSLQLS